MHVHICIAKYFMKYAFTSLSPGLEYEIDRMTAYIIYKYNHKDKLEVFLAVWNLPCIIFSAPAYKLTHLYSLVPFQS